MALRHIERHRDRSHRLAARRGLGANDGIVTTASLVPGAAAAHGAHEAVHANFARPL